MTHLQKLHNATHQATRRKINNEIPNNQHTTIATRAVCLPIEREIFRRIRHTGLLLDDPLLRATNAATNRAATRPR